MLFLPVELIVSGALVFSQFLMLLFLSSPTEGRKDLLLEALAANKGHPLTLAKKELGKQATGEQSKTKQKQKCVWWDLAGIKCISSILWKQTIRRPGWCNPSMRGFFSREMWSTSCGKVGASGSSSWGWSWRFSSCSVMRTRFLPLCSLEGRSHAAHGWRCAQGSVLCEALALGGREDKSRRRCSISSPVSVCSLGLRLRLAVRAFIFVVVHAV